MAQAIAPWIVTTVEGALSNDLSKLTRGPRAQVVDPSPDGSVGLSDKTSFIRAFLSETAKEELSNSTDTVKGTVIVVESYYFRSMCRDEGDLDVPDLCLFITRLQVLGASGSNAFGSPSNVNDFPEIQQLVVQNSIRELLTLFPPVNSHHAAGLRRCILANSLEFKDEEIHVGMEASALMSKVRLGARGLPVPPSAAAAAGGHRGPSSSDSPAATTEAEASTLEEQGGEDGGGTERDEDMGGEEKEDNSEDTAAIRMAGEVQQPSVQSTASVTQREAPDVAMAEQQQASEGDDDAVMGDEILKYYVGATIMPRRHGP